MRITNIYIAQGKPSDRKHELDIIERGTRQAKKLLEWMTPMVKKKILITDAKVPLLWLRNKDLRTQPFVQTRVHGICKLFDPDEMYILSLKTTLQTSAQSSTPVKRERRI